MAHDEQVCPGYGKDGCEMMRRAEGGDLIVKWWGVVIACVAVIASIAVALYRVDANERAVDDHEVVDMHPGARMEFRQIHERSARFEERQIHIQSDLADIRAEQRSGFERIEEALRDR